MWWEYYVPRVQQVIEKHFPEAPAATAHEWANRIFDDANFANSWDLLKRSNKSPGQDKVALASAAAQVRRAAAELRRLGWHGSDAVQGLVQWLAGMVPGRTVINPQLNGPLFLSMELDKIAERLEAALQALPMDASPILDLPLRDSARGQPTKQVHLDTAVRCAEVFQSLAKARPTIRVSEQNKAYGPFLDFVADVLRSLDIDASAEAAARYAVKEINALKG